MVKLEDINFTKVKDKEILAIDFTNTVTKIQVKKGDNIGFITEDGRKGIMNIAGASGRYIDLRPRPFPNNQGRFLGILLLPVFGPENVTGQKSCPVIILGSYIHICTHKRTF